MGTVNNVTLRVHKIRNVIDIIPFAHKKCVTILQYVTFKLKLHFF